MSESPSPENVPVGVSSMTPNATSAAVAEKIVTALRGCFRDGLFCDEDTEATRLVTEILDVESSRFCCAALHECQHENAKRSEIGNRMAEMLALAPEAPVEEWPDDDKIMAAVNEWRALPTTGNTQCVRTVTADLKSE